MNADIEFVTGGETYTEPPRRPRRPRRWIALVAIALAVAAIVVVATNGGRPARSHPKASNSTFAPGPRIGPLPPLPPHFVRPAATVFGPSAVDVAAAGNRIYALNATRIGTAGRWGANPITRALSFGAQPDNMRPTLEVDPNFDLVWAVAIGGTTLRGYDAQTLDPLVTGNVHHKIAAAAAMDGALWLATDEGLFVDRAAPGALRHVRGSPRPEGTVTPDPLVHTVLVTDENVPVRVHSFTAEAQAGSSRLPLQAVVSAAETMTGIWLSGRGPRGPRLVLVDPGTLRVRRVLRLPGRLHGTASIVGSYADRLLIRSAPERPTLYCVDGATGLFRQAWQVPPSAVSLDAHGLLVSTGTGVTQRDARACLSG